MLLRSIAWRTTRHPLRRLGGARDGRHPAAACVQRVRPDAYCTVNVTCALSGGWTLIWLAPDSMTITVFEPAATLSKVCCNAAVCTMLGLPIGTGTSVSRYGVALSSRK